MNWLGRNHRRYQCTVCLLFTFLVVTQAHGIHCLLGEVPQSDHATEMNVYLFPRITVEAPHATSGIREGIGAWYAVYRGSFSKVRGSVCAFTPSCSHYSQQAIAEYGFIKGIIMTGERLQRCHCCIDPTAYNHQIDPGTGRTLNADPVTDHASMFE